MVARRPGDKSTLGFPRFRGSFQGCPKGVQGLSKGCTGFQIMSTGFQIFQGLSQASQGSQCFLARLVRANVVACFLSASVPLGFDQDARVVSRLVCHRQFLIEENARDMVPASQPASQPASRQATV